MLVDLQFKYIDNLADGVKTMEVTMPYIAAVTLAAALNKVLAEPMPPEPVPANIEINARVDGKLSKRLVVIVTPPIQQKSSVDKKPIRDVCARCMASAYVEGVCDMCGSAGTVASALCIDKNVCTQCLMQLEFTGLTRRLN